MSMVEVMVAAVILSAGVLGVFVMVETADKVNERNRERITATSLARELLEKARPTTFATIGTSGWFDATLQGLSGRTGTVTNPTTHSSRATVTRRDTVYTVVVDTCTVDEGRDSYGTHAATTHWCSDSTTSTGTDTQPEDLKRVAVSMSWTGRGGKPATLYQTATFSSTGQVIGPTLSNLEITAPTGVSQTNPVITANPTSPAGIVRFLGTSAGSADMKFSVDGVEKATGVSGGNGSWTYDWNISSLPDGLYTIGATAVNALGVRGTPRVMQVRLARSAASPPANVIGGYNYVKVSGTSTLVVELMWDAAPEGNVTGYEVTKPGGTVCSSSLATTCMDLSPASSGSTTYTVKTLYTDGAGNAQSVSTTYNVTAPGTGGSTLPTQYVMKFDGVTMPGTQTSAKCKSAPVTTTTTYQQHFDMVPVGWSGSVWSTGFQNFALCLPVMTNGGTLSAGTMIFKSKWRNGGNNACTGVPIYLYLNGTTIIGGTGVNGGGTLPSLARRSASTYYTLNFTVNARTFAAGDQLSIYTTGGATNANCSQSQMDFGNGYNGTTSAQLDLPLGGGGGGATLTRPSAPTGLTSVDNGDGTATLTWTPPASAPELYRIYRDGSDYTHRVDTAGHTGDPTISWTDTDRGGTTHTYRVTAVSSTLAESDMAGPVTR